MDRLPLVLRATRHEGTVMAEIRKFSQETDDELQRLVRQQIGDTVLPTPPGPAEPADPPVSGESPSSAASDFTPVSSFLVYGDAPRPPKQSPSTAPERER